MKEFGLWFIIFGILCIVVLDMINLDFGVLAWVDNWGNSNGLIIRYGSIILGVVLFLKGRSIEIAKEAERKKRLNRYKY